MLKNFSLSGLMAVILLAPTLAFARTPEVKPLKINTGLHLGQVKKQTTDIHVALSGKVTAINGTSFTLTASNGTSYTVDASQTKLTRRYGGAMTTSDIQVNDQVFVQGILNGSTIKASTLQDFSSQTRNGSFTGIVQSVSSSSFVLKTQNRGLQTIHTSSATKILKGNDATTLSDLTSGASVRVEGVWNSTNNNVTASKVHIVIKAQEIRQNGTIAAINGNSMTLTGTEIGRAHV